MLNIYINYYMEWGFHCILKYFIPIANLLMIYLIQLIKNKTLNAICGASYHTHTKNQEFLNINPRTSPYIYAFKLLNYRIIL